MPGTHAILAPSDAHRWLYCTGSIALTKDLPDQSSTYSQEGTAAHRLAEICFTDKNDAKAHIGKMYWIGDDAKGVPINWDIDADMAGFVQVYLDYVRREAEDKSLLIEQKLPLTPFTGETDARGTADAVIIEGDTLTVIDLKFGVGVRVDAEKNEQLMMYALAAMYEYAVLGPFKKFKVVVVQPRLDAISEWAFGIKEMQVFERLVITQALEITNGKTELVVTEKGCRFCRAKANCPELAKQIHSMTEGAFDNLDTLPENDLSANMRAVDMIEGWCRAVRAEVERRLISGDKVTGYKLVQGRMGARAWGDAAEAEKTMRGLGMAEEVMYKKALVTPPALEKVYKNNPDAWFVLQALITQKEGPPSVAASTDPRPAIGSVGEQFEVLA